MYNSNWKQRPSIGSSVYNIHIQYPAVTANHPTPGGITPSAPQQSLDILLKFTYLH